MKDDSSRDEPNGSVDPPGSATNTELMNTAFSVVCRDKKCVLVDTSKRTMAQVLVEPADPSARPQIDRSPELGSVFGQGGCCRWRVEPQDGLVGEIWLSAHELHDFVLMGGELTNSRREPLYVDDLCPCASVPGPPLAVVVLAMRSCIISPATVSTLASATVAAT